MAWITVAQADDYFTDTSQQDKWDALTNKAALLKRATQRLENLPFRMDKDNQYRTEERYTDGLLTGSTTTKIPLNLKAAVAELALWYSQNKEDHLITRDDEVGSTLDVTLSDLPLTVQTLLTPFLAIQATFRNRATSFNYNTLTTTTTTTDNTTVPVAIDDLSDVDTSGVLNGQVLEWNGTNWVPKTLETGGAQYLGDLLDVVLGSDVSGGPPATNHFLKWDESGNWINSGDITGTYGQRLTILGNGAAWDGIRFTTATTAPSLKLWNGRLTAIRNDNTEFVEIQALDPTDARSVATKQYVDNNIPTIPTNVSTFTNDAGYITTGDIPTATSDLTNDSGFITSAAIPTNVSAFTNDAGYVTSAEVGGLQNILEDTTPQLGGDLDMNGHNIVDNTGGALTVSPATTFNAAVTVSGQLTSNNLVATNANLTTPKIAKIKNNANIQTRNEADNAYVGLDTDSIIIRATSNGINFAATDKYILATGSYPMGVYNGDVTLSTLRVGEPTATDHAATKNYVDNAIPTIPTNVSAFTNDAGYITSAAIPDTTSDLVNDSGFITSAAIPTNVSEFINDAGYITAADQAEVVADTTPQLGGHLDVNNFRIEEPDAGVDMVFRTTSSDTQIWGGKIKWEQKHVDNVNPVDMLTIERTTNGIEFTTGYDVWIPTLRLGNAVADDLSTDQIWMSNTGSISYGGMASSPVLRYDVGGLKIEDNQGTNRLTLSVADPTQDYHAATKFYVDNAISGAGVSGSTTLGSLNDVTITSPTTDQVLAWNGTGWVNQDAPSGGGGIYWGAYSNDDASTTSPLASGTHSLALGHDAVVSGNTSVAIGHSANVSSATAIGIGYDSEVSGGSHNIGIGSQSRSIGPASGSYGPSLAIGAGVGATGSGSVAIGSTLYKSSTTSYVNASGNGAIVLGHANTTSGLDASGALSITIGQNEGAKGLRSILLGLNAKATSDGSIAVGANAQSTANKGIAIGEYANASTANEIAIGEYASPTDGGLQIRTVSAAKLNMNNTGVVSSTGSFQMTNYTTAGRPTAGTAGRVVYDSDLGKLILDNGTAWVNLDGTAL